MFRQVVAYRWVDGVSPELLAMTCGDDTGHFDDNFDFVVVADFADFASARR